ncbi:MAG: TetR/AcrR family transcriptional regulator [Candidatus Dormibacteraeota bacterium]|jgi:AcrR family transcriptional regulator|nr:TetR/AcrR family transcriptional regulator [Candidatus Dormibacteraeota bacterium]
MSIPTPSEAPARRRRVVKSPADRRADILAAARQVFGAIGFAEATIDDLAAAARIGKGTFYRQFESKDHLLGALWERYVDAIVQITQQVLEDRADRPGEWWATLDQIMTTLIAHAVENADLHRIVYGQANAAALDICKQANHRVIDLICDYINRGADANAFQARHPTVAFRIAYHGIDGLLDNRISDREPIDTDDLTADALELLHRALGEPGRASGLARQPAGKRTTLKQTKP